MVDKIVGLFQACSVKPKDIPELLFQRANMLLTVYKDVIWCLEESIEELDRQSRELLGEDLAFAIEILDKFDYRLDKEKLDGHLYNRLQLRNILMLVAKALIKVKSYPRNGDIYFSILEKKYLLKSSYTEDEILYFHSISKTTYYKHKKDAVKIFGHCLWEAILPQYRADSELKAN